jgi:hypothetical protein
MNDLLEHPDEGLRDRIRTGFEANENNKANKIEDRPKTSRNKRRHNGKVLLSKNITEIPMYEITRKPKSEVEDEMKKLTLNQTKPIKNIKNVPTVYLCYKCDKTYKSKNGIIKHMSKCIYINVKEKKTQ